MKKVAVIGIDTMKEQLISDLMEMGVVEITDQSSKLITGEFDLPVDKDGNEEKVAELDRKISQVSRALETLEHYNPEKKPLIVTRKGVKKKDFAKTLENKEKIQADIEYVLSLNDKLQKTQDQINRANSDLTSVTPWQEYTLPLEMTGTETTGMTVGILPSSIEMEPVLQEIADKTDNAIVREVSRDKDLIYLAVLVTREKEEDVISILKQYGFTAVSFKDLEGTPKEIMARKYEEISALHKECEDIEAEIGASSHLIYEIECVHDSLSMERGKEQIKERLMKTERTFYFEGWVPVPCEESVTKALEDNGCYFAMKNPEEDEEVPVLTHNSSFITPFEAITDMYSLPDYHGIDPTKYFAIFYALFFGIMLSDAGYGIIITIATFIIMKKFDLEGMMAKMIKMFFFCGISTIFWGAMFGGWFGDIVPVVARTFFDKEIVIESLWFNPLDDPTKLLIFSLLFGVVHIFLGMALSASMMIRRGHLFDAICDVFSWYMVIAGAGLWLAGGMLFPAAKTIGMYVAIAGAAILLLTGGRKKKGLGKITGGLGQIYNVTSYVSDILSYARLLALGLATGVIAQVVNTMGTLMGGGVLGAIVLVIVFLIGHTFNLAINALGSFVHASRLQYIEFFGKFYEDGGEPFAPFKKETKYVKLINDANGGKIK